MSTNIDYTNFLSQYILNGTPAPSPQPKPVDENLMKHIDCLSDLNKRFDKLQEKLQAKTNDLYKKDTYVVKLENRIENLEEKLSESEEVNKRLVREIISLKEQLKQKEVNNFDILNEIFGGTTKTVVEIEDIEYREEVVKNKEATVMDV